MDIAATCLVNDTDFKCLEIKTTCFQADCRDYKLYRKCYIFLNSR